jgi:uncharacterized LabA/DUF88 family protein
MRKAQKERRPVKTGRPPEDVLLRPVSESIQNQSDPGNALIEEKQIDKVALPDTATESSRRKSASPRRVVVYVDGFNLYFGLRASKWQRYYWLDVVALSRRLIRQNQVLVGVRYFSARITRPPDKVARQALYLQALQTIDGLTMEFGQYRSDKEYCVRCCRPRFIDDEKMTDVNIAVSMLVDAADDKFDVAFLVSGDTDLVNAVRAVQTRFKPKEVWMTFPPNRGSTLLSSVATGRVRIKEWMLREAQMPRDIMLPGGFTAKCPEEWA